MVDFYLQLPLFIQALLKGLAVIMVIFPLAGMCSMAERKVSAWIQGRPGPNRAIVPWVAWIPVVGPFLQRLGLFHVMADGGKMLFKEDALPGHVNRFYFLLAPVVAMIPALTTVTTVPFGAYLDPDQGARCATSSWRRVDDTEIPARAKVNDASSRKQSQRRAAVNWQEDFGQENWEGNLPAHNFPARLGMLMSVGWPVLPVFHIAHFAFPKHLTTPSKLDT